MTILQYYLEKQKEKQWVNLYQGIGNDSYGKIFTYYSTNFRRILSFVSQFNSFKNVINVPRNEWPKNKKTGQEDDKQRVSNLLNASFIEEYITAYDKSKPIKAYKLTNKGIEFNNIINLKENNSISENDLWFLTLLLIFDYKTNNDNLILIKEAVNLCYNLNECGITTSNFLEIIKKILLSENKESLFFLDGFWLITFNKEKEFLRKYIASTEEEKNDLYKWVSNCAKDKKSTDCVAHKFVNGGNYSHGFFIDEVYTLIFIIISILLQSNSVEHLSTFLIKIFESLNRHVNKDKIIEIISKNKIYQEIYTDTISKLSCEAEE